MRLLLLCLVPACFALNPITGRAMADTFGPASLSLVRWLLSAAVIAAIALPRTSERWQAPAPHLIRIGLLGAFGMGFAAYAAFAASRTAAATNISLIYGCASAAVASWEIAAGRQRATGALLLGIATCVAGAAVLIVRGEPRLLAETTFTHGDLWAIAGMLVFSAYTVTLRRMPALLSPMAQFTVMGIGATLALLPFAAAEVAAAGLPVLTLKTLPWIVVLVLLTGIGAFLGYNLSLARNGPVLTSASLTLTPVYTAGLAVLLIGEQLAWYHAAAVVLVVAGLLLINRGQRK